MTFPVRWLLAGILLRMLAPAASASTISLGAFSYDTFIPAGTGSPGVDAFDLANLTGAFDLPPDFPVSDSLTFQSAILTLTLSDSSQQIFDLGDIGPGFLLDGNGNPVVQVAGDQVFTSAEFMATLSATNFMLFGGTDFTSSSDAIDIVLLPAAGPSLTADVDQITIDVANTPAASVPEPGTGLLALVAGTGLLWGAARRSANQSEDV